jgi:hypothetical protein
MNLGKWAEKVGYRWYLFGVVSTVGIFKEWCSKFRAVLPDSSSDEEFLQVRI